MKKMKHLLTLLDFSRADLEAILHLGIDLKKSFYKGKSDLCLQGKTLAMIFEKASTRTRVSFEVAMFQLGGHAIHLDMASSQLGRGESYEDTARVLSGYVQGIMLRTFSQVNLEKMASVASVPVINGLTDLFHPVQVLADLMTILENKKNIDELKIAYVGDGNNMTNSWINAAIIFGFDLNVATPAGYEPSGQILQEMSSHPNIEILQDPVRAVKSADVICTDTWFSMGQKEDAQKHKLFTPFQVNKKLLSHALDEVMVLHCLPAHRGEEITNEVMDGSNSFIFREAENRLHIQKAILKTLMQ